jgi:mediator of RNA polymerase II transcription subunit 12
MSEILSERSAESIDVNRLKRVGELLRVLVQVAEPLRDTPNSIPTIDPLVQETFLQVILGKFKLLKSLPVDRESCSEWRESMILPRLIQFILGFKCNWTQGSKEVAKELSDVIFDILLVCQAIVF